MLEYPSILRYTESMRQCENPLGADNQQERSILTPDFLAGLIVGEGSYFLGVSRWKSGSMAMVAGFSLRMNDADLIDRVQEAFACYNLDLYRNPAVYHCCHSISVAGNKRMRQHLDFFLPLLAGNKLAAAEVVSEFVDRRLQLKSRELTDEDVDLLERVRAINGPTRRRVPIEILRAYTRRPSGRGRPKGSLGNIESGLHGDMQRPAEMTGPVLLGE